MLCGSVLQYQVGRITKALETADTAHASHIFVYTSDISKSFTFNKSALYLTEFTQLCRPFSVNSKQAMLLHKRLPWVKVRDFVFALNVGHGRPETKIAHSQHQTSEQWAKTDCNKPSETHCLCVFMSVHVNVNVSIYVCVFRAHVYSHLYTL